MVLPPPSDQWFRALDEYNARLANQLTVLDLRTRQLHGVVPPALALAMEELTTATEELRASQEELQMQAAALEDTEGRLEASRRHYQELFDLCPDAYLVTDTAGVIKEANQAISALVGYARTYVLGKPLTALLDPRAAADFLTKLVALRAADGERPQTWDLDLRPRRMGPTRRASIRVAPMHDRAGNVIGFRWLVRDVTEQQATAAALAQVQATQARTLRARTMELEAVVRMQQEIRMNDQTVLRRLSHDAIQSLQHGADPQALLTHVLTTLQTQLNDDTALSGVTHPSSD